MLSDLYKSFENTYFNKVYLNIFVEFSFPGCLRNRYHPTLPVLVVEFNYAAVGSTNSIQSNAVG